MLSILCSGGTLQSKCVKSSLTWCSLKVGAAYKLKREAPPFQLTYCVSCKSFISTPFFNILFPLFSSFPMGENAHTRREPLMHEADSQTGPSILILTLCLCIAATYLLNADSYLQFHTGLD
jgi:hypothetical protein